MTSAPVIPRPAATVLLVRDHLRPGPGRPPLQVFLQQRVTGMAFAAGMTVFPGGGVDTSDRPDPDHWAGPEPRWWAERLGVDVELAGALVQAAVRETFEECGVLLAGPGVPADLQGQRADVVARRRSFAEVLATAGLVLRADLLHAWARWITPVGSARRYDTAFFVAQVPDGQEADAHTTEAVRALWWHPSEALERWQDGGMLLMPPTVRTLQEIAELDESAAVLAAAREREIRPIVPTLRRDGDRMVTVLPDNTAFPSTGLPGQPA
jgi:8-oxo-dGTP pyrophosphatase MutT (NUDIX family)